MGGAFVFVFVFVWVRGFEKKGAGCYICVYLMLWRW